MESCVFSPSVAGGDSFLSPLSTSELSVIREKLVGQWPVALGMSHFSTDQFKNSDYEKYQISLSSSIEKAVSKRRAEYLAARICARSALKRLGIDAIPQSIQGERRPYWPPHFTGSITHGDGIAASCVSSTKYAASIGLDIERWIVPEKVARLAPAILTENELTYWNTKTIHEKSIWLTRIFSAKETLFKLLYPLVDRSFYFHDAEVTEFEKADNDELSLHLRVTLNEDFTKGNSIRVRYCDMEHWVITMSLFPTR